MVSLSNDIENDTTIKKAIMLITTLDEPNLNGTIITKENAMAHMDTLINKPCLAYYYVDAEGVERLGDHEYKYELDENGKIVGVHFNTTPIGVFTRVWIDKVGNYDLNASKIDKNKEAIFAEAVLWSERFPNTMRVVEDMYDQGISVSSYEIEIYESEKTMTGKSLINFAFIGHTLLGVPPACPISGIKELSQLNDDKFIMSDALRKDLKINKKVSNKERGNNSNMENTKINKTIASKEDMFKILASLTDNDLRSKVWKAINDTDDNTWYYVVYIIPYEYKAYAQTYSSDETEFIEFTYKVNSDDTVTIESQKTVKMKFIPVADDSTTDTASVDVITLLKKNLAEKEQEINKKNKELSNKNEAILNIESQLKDKDSEISNKEKEISELKPFKEKIEKAEKEQAELKLSKERAELKAFALDSGYIKEEELSSNEELKKALEQVDSKTIKAEVIDRIVAAQKKEIENKTNNTKEVEVSSKTPKLNINNNTEETIDPYKLMEDFVKSEEI